MDKGDGCSESIPFKVVDSNRERKFGVVASSLQDFVDKACAKLNITGPVKVVLELDGTEVDEEDYFSTLECNTCLMVLADSEKWVQQGRQLSAQARTTDDEKRGESVRFNLKVLGENNHNVQFKINNHTGDKKAAESEHINVKVKKDDFFVNFRIKKDTSFDKLIKTYCEGRGLDPTAVRFRFDGDPIAGRTPSSLEMEEGDIIEVFPHMESGGFLMPVVV